MPSFPACFSIATCDEFLLENVSLPTCCWCGCCWPSVGRGCRWAEGVGEGRQSDGSVFGCRLTQTCGRFVPAVRGAPYCSRREVPACGGCARACIDGAAAGCLVHLESPFMDSGIGRACRRLEQASWSCGGNRVAAAPATCIRGVQVVDACTYKVLVVPVGWCATHGDSV